MTKPDICQIQSRQFRVEVNLNETGGPLMHFLQTGHPFSCFLGLSSDTSFVNKGRLSAILQWLHPKVSHLMIVEGSFLTRWNLRAIDGYSESEAERIAEERHKIAMARITKTVKKVCGETSVQVLDWPSIVHSTAFARIRERIGTYSAQTPSFLQSLDLVVEEYLSRKHSPSKIASISSQQLELLRSYVVEEIAMFVHLYYSGYKLEFYPGDDLKIMREIAVGSFIGFPFEISERTHVSLRLLPYMIRQAKVNDEATVLRLIDAWPTHFVKAAKPLVIEDFHKAKTFIYEDQGSPLGFLIWTENEAEIELLWLAVHPEAVYKGIGRSLVAEVEAQATSQRRFFLKTATTDSVIPETTFSGDAYQGTNDFFVKLGYESVERIINGWGPGNHCLIMEKLGKTNSWTNPLTTKSSQDLVNTSALC